ncbi:MAG: porin [Pseudomonadota bacterium]
MRNTLLVSSIALLSATTGAIAGNMAEPIVTAPPAPVVIAPTPSADWTGFYAGGQYTFGDAEATDDTDTISADVDGFGIHAGYLYDTGSFVIGGEFDYDMLSSDDSDVDVMRLKGIAGYDMGEFMPYVTAGIGRADDETDDVDLTFFGIGGSYQVSDSFRIGAEYLMHDLDTDDLAPVTDFEVDSLSLRASFSF